MAHARGIVWLRRDLRLADNPALEWARHHADELALIYIHAPEEDREWAPGAASRWWLHHALASLEETASRLGQHLAIYRGSSVETLLRLAAENGCDFVCWTRLYDPASVPRDKAVKTALRTQGIDAHSFNGSLLFEPWEVTTANGAPYRVFSPFWRNCQQKLATLPPQIPAPETVPPPPASIRGEGLKGLDLLPGIRWDQGLASSWTPGERGAQTRLRQFIADAATRYDAGRNRPDLAATSKLSPHLHFGELSPRQTIVALHAADLRGRAGRSAEMFVRELGWREFAHHLLYHFPATTTRPLDERFTHYPWIEDGAALLAWQRGRTGYPIIDAGMRELWHTGWMHNRVRMIVASFLTKNLRVDWLEGARWFWDTLVDADLANNTLGWQWTAGCGADAAPYFRIFNPTLQAERHDPERAYLRRWLPELARLPDAWIHRPSEAPSQVLAAAGVVLGNTYPTPLVELRASRAQALEGYERIKRTLP